MNTKKLTRTQTFLIVFLGCMVTAAMLYAISKSNIFANKDKQETFTNYETGNTVGVQDEDGFIQYKSGVLEKKFNGYVVHKINKCWFLNGTTHMNDMCTNPIHRNVAMENIQLPSGELILKVTEKDEHGRTIDTTIIHLPPSSRIRKTQ